MQCVAKVNWKRVEQQHNGTSHIKTSIFIIERHEQREGERDGNRVVIAKRQFATFDYRKI